MRMFSPHGKVPYFQPNRYNVTIISKTDKSIFENHGQCKSTTASHPSLPQDLGSGDNNNYPSTQALDYATDLRF
jgi:hypothetical protein